MLSDKTRRCFNFRFERTVFFLSLISFHLIHLPKTIPIGHPSAAIAFRRNGPTIHSPGYNLPSFCPFPTRMQISNFWKSRFITKVLPPLSKKCHIRAILCQQTIVFVFKIDPRFLIRIWFTISNSACSVKRFSLKPYRESQGAPYISKKSHKSTIHLFFVSKIILKAEVIERQDRSYQDLFCPPLYKLERLRHASISTGREHQLQ